MDKKEQILHYYRIDGLSQQEIARSVGVSRKTVKRYITEYETLVNCQFLRLAMLDYATARSLIACY